jgi:phage tail sheath protein FI
MPTYATPGVYVEEIPARSKPIEGVSTSTAAFVGLAPGGPLNRPVEISNWSQFERTYSDPANPADGPFMEGAYLAHAVNGFFANGGQLCWVVRVGTDDAPAPRAMLPSATDRTKIGWDVTAKLNVDEDIKVDLILEAPAARAQIAANSNGGKGASTAKDAGGAAASDTAKNGGKGDPPPKLYTVSVQVGRDKPEKHEHLLAADLPTLKSDLITLTLDPDVAQDKPEDLAKLEPAPGTYYLSVPPIQPSEITTSNVEGDVANRKGLGSLQAVVDVSMVCVPDLMAIAGDDDFHLREAQGQLIAHCENMGDRLAILDTPPARKVPSDALDWLLNDANYDSKQATVYYPWVEVMDPITKFPLLVPPCGHVAGVWARTDSTRGVHKAPANEAILGITGLGFHVTDAEQGDLNRSGLNCIRAFSGRGIRVWGARTISSDPEWRYINVRRLVNFISDSIMRGTQWAVFEPNDERLWIQLQIAVTNFLTIQWRAGALFGGTPDAAFYVKCDTETNPPELIEAGQVTTEVGIAPVKPAEFVVFRISQYTAGEGAAA